MRNIISKLDKNVLIQLFAEISLLNAKNTPQSVQTHKFLKHARQRVANVGRARAVVEEDPFMTF
jgi:hypothetical protein